MDEAYLFSIFRFFFSPKLQWNIPCDALKVPHFIPLLWNNLSCTLSKHTVRSHGKRNRIFKQSPVWLHGQNTSKCFEHIFFKIYSNSSTQGKGDDDGHAYFSQPCQNIILYSKKTLSSVRKKQLMEKDYHLRNHNTNLWPRKHTSLCMTGDKTISEISSASPRSDLLNLSTYPTTDF